MIVIDASIAIKWIREEDWSQSAFILYQKHIDNLETIQVPELIFIEVANALTTKSDFSTQEVNQALTFIFQANLTVKNITSSLLLQATKLAKKHHTSVYDMLYAVIAQNTKSTLVTADQNFIQKTKFPNVKHISQITTR